jgi:hypothetical protein
MMMMRRNSNWALPKAALINEMHDEVNGQLRQPRPRHSLLIQKMKKSFTSP